MSELGEEPNSHFACLISTTRPSTDMQQPPPPPAAASEPHTQEAALQLNDSVVAGDTTIHTGDVHNTTVVQQGPTTLGWFNLGLVVVAIILATTSMLTDAWLVNHDEISIMGTTIESEVEMGLDDYTATVCYDGVCETIESDMGDDYDDCVKNLEELEIDSDDDAWDSCNELGEVATAGLTGIILISFGIVALLGAGALLVLKQLGRQFPFSELSPIAGGVLGLVGVVLWWALLPDGGDAKLGWSAWISITSGALALLAGLSPSIVKMYSPGERVAGIGARALGEDECDREFVIRESFTGDSALSLIWVNELLSVVNVERSMGETKVEDRFMTRREALSGFSHERYDWLDTYRYIWWILAGAGIIFLFIYPLIGALLFIIGSLLTLAQFADPEFITLDTTASRHRILLYRLGSNRELTNASMDMIDDTMKRLLSGDVLDASALNECAQQIEETRQLPELEASPSVTTAQPYPAPPAQEPEAVPAPVPEVVPEPIPEPEPEVVAEPEPEPEVVAEPEPEPAPPPVEIPPPPPPPSTPVLESAPEPATAPAPAPPPVSEPAPMTAPPPPPPMPVPAPPPAPAPMSHADQPPPPPGEMAGLPPPPPAGMGGLPPPPPPPGASPFAPTMPAEPSELHVKAAPREDSLSADEALDLLSDLSE